MSCVTPLDKAEARLMGAVPVGMSVEGVVRAKDLLESRLAGSGDARLGGAHCCLTAALTGGNKGHGEAQTAKVPQGISGNRGKMCAGGGT
jgi:hypothetical protein